MNTTTTRALLLAAVLVLAATAADAESGRCYTAPIPRTIALPDGSERGPGDLRICNERAISPVSSLQRISLDGRLVGIFLSVPRSIEQGLEAGTAQFVFKPGAAGELNLIGFATGSRNEAATFQTFRNAGGSAYMTGESDDEFVLIASAGRTNDR